MKVLFIKEIEGVGNHFVDLNTDESGNQTPQEIYLQLTADDTMTVKGTVKDNSDIENVNLGLINLTDYSVLEAATKAGLYAIDGASLSSITINLTNGEKVIVKVGY